jgi:histidinol-phosphate aminotransferase
MSRAPRRGFPRPDYASIELYSPDRRPVSVDLCDNTNRWGPHPDALAAVRGAAVERLTRYPVLYADPLREAAATAFGVGPDQITTGTGSDDVLDSLWRAVAEYGGTITYPAPTFSMIEPLCRMNGREARPVTWADAARNPSILLDGDPCLIYVCRPNNPTGHSVGRAWIDDLVAAADDSAAGGPAEAAPVIVFDEAYADYADDTLIPLAVERPRTIVMRTLSKAYGLAGLRAGFGIGTAETILEVEKSRGPYKVNHLAEVAGAAALRDEAGWVEQTVGEAVANRERFLAELERRGLEPLPSNANFVFLPVAEGTARDLSNAFRAHDVAIRPFGAEAGFTEGIRISIGPWAEMARVLEVVDALRDELLAGSAGGGGR